MTKRAPMKDLTLIIENVRTFRGRHEIPIRPLTILTGENSSGKTTVLALFAAMCDRESYPLWPDFNSAPYSLGNYDTIASCENDEKEAAYFSLGFRKPDRKPQDVTEEYSRYVSERGLVRLKKFQARVAGFEFSLGVSDDTLDGLAGEATIRNRKWKTTFQFSRLEAYSAAAELSKLVLEEAGKLGKTAPPNLLDLSSHLLHLTPARITSIAPTRTRPQRVYSQTAETYKPTGEHIPFLLEQLMEEDAGSPKLEFLLRVFRIFGNQSGLFEELTVNRLGNKSTAPFELQVELDNGTRVNLVDVGYGVSQVLPLLVEASTASPDQYLLLQEPEIHLHPRAQAALGTLFAQLAAEDHCRLMVETHSDYLMDRVRQEVAAGKIAPEMVALLYLHREGLETKCHLIELDRLGNLIDPPDNYRSFFLEEEWRLLRRGARH